MQTVRGDADSVERRLVAGLLRCPCSGVLRPWSHAASRVIRTPLGPKELRPRRSRCGVCGTTHVLLPTWLFARRGYAGVIIWACVLAWAAGVKVASIAARARVPVSTVAEWLRRIGDRGPRLRQVLMGVLAVVDGQVREVVPAGSALSDAVTVLGAVVAGVRRRGGLLATLTDQEMVSHLTRGLLLAPACDLGSCNTNPFVLPAPNSS